MLDVNAEISATQSPHLRGDLALPTIAELLSDSQEMERRALNTIFIYRTPPPGVIEEEGLHQNTPFVGTTSEAALLTDFDRFVSTHDTLAQDLRYAPFLGVYERTLGVDHMARHWLAKLEQSPENEIIALIETNDSSSYIYSLVEDAIRAINPEAAGRILPVTHATIAKYKSSLKDRIAEHGLVLPDDWSVTSLQLDATISLICAELQDVIPDIREKLEINLLCAPQKTIQRGIEGVACLAAYQFGFERARGAVSVGGAHSIPAVGFRREILRALNTGNDKTIGDRHAFLLQLIAVYKTFEHRPDVRLLTPEQAEMFYAQQRRIQAIGKLAAGHRIGKSGLELEPHVTK
jgi:hypothetical protein